MHMKLETHIAAAKEKWDVLPVFGFIMYTRMHANIVKTLSDENYWTQLDLISGERLAVFSAKAIPGKYENPEPIPGMINMLVKTWSEPMQNLELLSTFQLSTTEHLPALVLFAKDGDETIQCFVPLSDKSPQDAHQSLTEALRFLADAASKISPANAANTMDVFASLKEQTRQFNECAWLKRSVKWLPLIRSVLDILSPPPTHS